MKDINYIRDAKTKAILENVEQKMLNVFQDKLKSIILYGSCARNENLYESDMDVMVLIDEKEETIKKYEDQITDIMVDISLENDIVLSLYTQSIHEYQKQEKYLPFIQNIQSEGIRVYG